MKNTDICRFLLKFASKTSMKINMKNIFLPIFTALMAVLCLTACVQDDEQETLVYQDTALLNFVIRAGKVAKTTKNAAGQDSSYTVMADLSHYRFHIDQLTNTIYNTQKLPFGTNITKLVGTMVTKNGGVVFVKYGTLAQHVLFRATDSIDYSAPVDVRVYDVKGEQYRSYTLTVNVEKQAENAFSWNDKLATVNELKSLQNIKLLQLGSKMLAFGIDGATTKVFETALNDGKNWVLVSGDMVLGADVCENVASIGNKLFVLVNHSFYESEDAKSWTIVSENTIARLLGANGTSLYALKGDGGLVVSTDNGKNWKEEALDSDKKYLPQSKVFVTTQAGSVMFLGLDKAIITNDIKPIHIWRELPLMNNGTTKSIWTYYGRDAVKGLPANAYQTWDVIEYANSLMTVVKNTDAKTMKAQPFVYYVSKDGGLNWAKSNSLYLPKTLNSEATNVAQVIDTDGNVWLVAEKTGEVWKASATTLK